MIILLIIHKSKKLYRYITGKKGKLPCPKKTRRRHFLTKDCSVTKKDKPLKSMTVSKSCKKPVTPSFDWTVKCKTFIASKPVGKKKFPVNIGNI